MEIKKIIYKIIIGGIISFIGLFSNFDPAISFILIVLGYLIIGGDILYSAISNVFRGNLFDENFLMSIATVGAFIIGEYFEAIIVMLFFQIGEAFQSYAVGKSRKSIKDLMDIMPDIAVVKRDGKEIEVSPSDVKKGETLVIRPGEKIPLDGFILIGSSSLDTKALTGESIPKDVFEGDEVVSGCININGLLEVKVTNEYTESTAVKIMDLVENASSRKSPSEKFITKFAKYYTPAVVVAAFFLAIIPPLFFNGNWQEWIYRALSFLVVSCPCALVISIPLGFFGGIGGASKNGILIKGSNYIESLSKANIFVFDKTGTLTKGEFKISEIHSPKMSENELLEIAAYAEKYSNHPIAKAIIKAYNKEIDLSKINNFKEIAGNGVSINYNGDEIHAGNKHLMEKLGVNVLNVDDNVSIVFITKNNELQGYITLEDEIKEDASLAIKKLKNRNIKKTIMLTGDKKAVAKKIGDKILIDEVRYELLPQNKVEIVESEIEKLTKKEKLVYVGDGINDAPVLARADIGIAMGGLGQEAAIEAADIVILNDEISKVATAYDISKKTMRIVKENIALSFIIKGVVLILSGFGMSSLLEAIFADVGVAILAILNAMRIMNYKGEK